MVLPKMQIIILIEKYVSGAFVSRVAACIVVDIFGGKIWIIGFERMTRGVIVYLATPSWRLFIFHGVSWFYLSRARTGRAFCHVLRTFSKIHLFFYIWRLVSTYSLFYDKLKSKSAFNAPCVPSFHRLIVVTLQQNQMNYSNSKILICNWISPLTQVLRIMQLLMKILFII